MQVRNHIRIYWTNWTTTVLLGVGLAFGGFLNRVNAESIDSRNNPIRVDSASAKLVAAEIDRRIAEEVWDTLPTPHPAAARRADDYTFLRRLSFDTIGYPPSVEEIKAFVDDSSTNKRAAWVKRRLADPRFADNWARYWRDVVMSRQSDRRARLAHEPFRKYLTESFAKKRPWDEIARQLITADGDVREHGETAVIMAQIGEPEDTVAELTRTLLGIQIQCAQCHDHPYDVWEREQFHELAAFFPRVAVRPSAKKPIDFRVYAVDYAPRFARKRANANRYRGELEHAMPDLDDPNAPGELMTPTFFVNGKSVPLGTNDADRRGQLAIWFTEPDNPWFARAFVNRIWTELIGSGFYDSVDDLGPERDCHAPETLDYICQQFVAHDHDIQWLFVTIMATDAYGRESRSRSDPPETTFLWNHPTRLRANQLFHQITTALEIPLDRLPGGRARPNDRPNDRPNGGGVMAVFEAAFQFDPSLPADEVTGSMAQSLQLMNSPIINRVLNRGTINGLREVTLDGGDLDDLLELLYLRCLSRPPTPSETRQATRAVRKAANPREGLQDVLWALVNSSEFLHRS